MSTESHDLLEEIQKEEDRSLDANKKAEEKSTIESKPIDIDSRTGFRIKSRIVSESKCDLGLKNVQYIPLKQVESHTQSFNSIRVGVKPTSHWSTIGIIDKCYPHSEFCVTRITDMRGTYRNLYITGKAYSKFENAIGMGSVIVIKRPFLLKPTESNQSIALHVDQIQQLWVIGLSLDLKQCSGYKSKDKRCDEWMDIRSGEFCNKHLERVYGYSKNGRMELASGDSGFDIRWATKTRQADGTYIYESKRESKRVTPSFNFGLNTKMKEAYYIKGLGLIATDGSLIQKKLTPQCQNPEEKALLEELLRDSRDPGAQMLRKIKGINDKVSKDVLSKEALAKMGMGRKLTQEEEESKKRSFAALTKASVDKPEEAPEKKPKYVYL